MVVGLIGPTASGKSQLALDVVRAVRSGPELRTAVGSVTDVELVSVDSMAVYRGMDIGTTKPTPAVRGEVGYHLLDLVDADEEYTVTRYQRDARAALAGIESRSHGAVLVGGTGLYLRSITDGLAFPGRFPAVAAELIAGLDRTGPTGSGSRSAACGDLHARLHGLDPVAASRIEPGNERRIVRALEVTIGSGQPFSSFGPGLERYPPTPVALVGLQLDAEEVDRRIARRFHELMDDGLLDEVRQLAARPSGISRTARQALGYRELLSHVEGGVPLDSAVDEAIQRTRRFARRQRSWFRRDPRIEWVGTDDDPVEFVVARLAGGTAGRTGPGEGVADVSGLDRRAAGSIR